MSYDLAVFGTRSLSLGEVAKVIRDAQGLDVAEHDPGDSGLVAVRGKQRLYCFTVDGPFQLEPEDVPEEITAVLLDATHIYTIMVEGSAAAAVPHAARFARRLARAVEGAVQDQQTGEVWARGASRKAVRPARAALIDIVQIHWYALHRDMPTDIAARYLALSRRYLPEALPRRFGSFEPFQHKLEADGDQAFIQAQKAETSLLFFTSQPPCFGGSLAGGQATAYSGPVSACRLDVDRSALRDRRWRGALKRLLAGFAAESGSFFASAEVVRNLDWTGRGLGYGPAAERTTFVAPRGQWQGLPPYPVWWSWYSPVYAGLVAPHLPAESAESTANGLFHSWGDDPLDRDQLEQALSRTRTLFRRRQSATWIPEELLARPELTDPRLHNPPVQPAAEMPVILRIFRETGQW
jgi:hypothetical protein